MNFHECHVYSTRLNCAQTFKFRLLWHWHTLLNLVNTHPCKSPYLELIFTCGLYLNWATDVRQLLFSIGLGYICGLSKS
jgi:hypothetical protein